MLSFRTHPLIRSVRRLLARGIPGLLAITTITCLAGSAPSAEVAAGAGYDVRFEGVEDAALIESLRSASELVKQRERPSPGLRGLRRRADEDLERLRKVLRSRGFYSGAVSYRIEPQAKQRPLVVVDVKTGPVYRLSEYRIRSADPSGPQRAIFVTFKSLGIAPGDVGDAGKIVRSQSAVLAALAHEAHPLASVANRKVVVDHATQAISVDLTVDAGPAAQFGATRIDGLTRVDAAVVRRSLAWREGDPFDAILLEKTRRRLRETGLFAAVSVRQGDAVDASGALPVTITVTERKHRSIGAGAGYSTTEGGLAKVFWEHRNLFGQGERLNLRAELGEIRFGGFGELRIPDVLRRDQDVVVDFRVSEERPDGFRSTDTATSARLERRFAEVWSGSIGLGFDRSNIDENGIERNFSLTSLPLALKRDTADDILDPGRGGRMSLGLTPYRGVLGTDVQFAVARFSDSIYVSILPEKELVAAGWARIGSIMGATTPAIPANKRLYAGGGGSVRGYGLNSVGPLDAQNDPVGGRSSTEFGLELRWRAFGPVGLVGFVEGGAVYDSSIPRWGNDLQWSAGVGARYYTAIGPLRLDVAVPLNRRNAVDDAFAIIVSLGQAF